MAWRLTLAAAHDRAWLGALLCELLLTMLHARSLLTQTRVLMADCLVAGAEPMETEAPAAEKKEEEKAEGAEEAAQKAEETPAEEAAPAADA